MLGWLMNGCRSVAPVQVKIRAVRSYQKAYAMTHFIETGTYRGDTLWQIARTGIQCTSIELSEELHRSAQKRFQRHKNVNLVQGDSGKELPKLLEELHEPALFWLDGHYSAGITAKSEVDTPISAELQAILTHPIKQHVILIDDARCFDGTNDYPHLDHLLRQIREDGNYRAEVSIDIIRLTPRR